MNNNNDVATITLAKQLITCPSITPLDHGCQIIIARELAPLGFHSEALRFGEVDNLWIRYGEKAPLLVLAGHTDVVPPGPLAEWTEDPWKPIIRDGFLYGRGACDMKGALAAMVVATQNFIRNQPHFPGSIAFLLTSDEEGPAIHGTKKVIETLLNQGVQIAYCLIGEPSSDIEVGDQIRIGRRGSLHGKLTIRGKQGHVAHPHLAINPIHNSFAALKELVDKEWDKGNEDYPQTSLQITNIHGGTGAANIIPGHFDIMFNFRFGTASPVTYLQKQTEAILQKHKLSFDIHWDQGAEPFLPKKGRLITVTQEAIREITKRETKLSTGGGTSDGRFIAKTGAEIVELGVSNNKAHHIDECVRITDLVMLTTIYERIFSKLFSA